MSLVIPNRVLAGFFALIALAAAGDDPFEGVRQTILAEIEKGRLPSLAVAVARNGRVAWEEGFGWADLERHIPATHNTIYSLASVSKPMTATALMILVERGQVELDRPINDYLGQVKLAGHAGQSSKATVRMLLAHSSGLPLHYNFFPQNEAYPRPPMEETIRRYGILVTKPGEKYQYSNLGYGIAGYIIERVSGMKYEKFMKEEVFRPLGLSHTSVPTAPDSSRRWAIRYWDSETPLPFYDFDHRGASAVFSSVHNLVRFGMFHLKVDLRDQKPILTDRSIDQMKRPIARRSVGRGYAMGWQIFRNGNGPRVVAHTGSMGGVTAWLILVPQEKVAVALLANTQTDFVQRIGHQIITTLLPQYGRGGTNDSKGSTAEDLTDIRGSRSKLPRKIEGVWTGIVRTYEGQLPLKLWLRRSSESEGQLDDQPRSTLTKVKFQDGHLSAWMDGDIRTEDANRRPYVLVLSLKLRGRLLNGSITALSPSSPELPNALSSWVELKKVTPRTRIGHRAGNQTLKE